MQKVYKSEAAFGQPYLIARMGMIVKEYSYGSYKIKLFNPDRSDLYTTCNSDLYSICKSNKTFGKLIIPIRSLSIEIRLLKRLHPIVLKLRDGRTWLD